MWKLDSVDIVAQYSAKGLVTESLIASSIDTEDLMYGVTTDLGHLYAVAPVSTNYLVLPSSREQNVASAGKLHVSS